MGKEREKSCFRQSRLVFFARLCLAAALLNWAASDALAVKNSSDPYEDLEIEGLLVNQTVTHVGLRFYEQFAVKWIPPKGVASFNIVFRERPDPQYGTFIWVTVNDIQVFAQRFSRRGTMDEAVNNALRAVYRYVLTMKLKVDSPDLDLHSNGL